MACSKCCELRKLISKTPVVSGEASYPSIKELAYMVNLEYYIQMHYRCIHEIPENNKVKDILKFLDDRKWQMGTRVSNEGEKKSC
jgi:hypothetical protein